jgi:hypothetical protein
MSESLARREGRRRGRQRKVSEPMCRAEYSLVAAGVLGFALAGVGHYALGLHWLTTTGILLAGGSCM